MARTPALTGLPHPNTRRWVARRKAAVVAAVSSGMISLEEACRRYQMSEAEFLTWQRAFEIYGVKGLHATLLQQRRELLSSAITNPVSAPKNSPREGFDRAAKEYSAGTSIHASSLPEKG